MAKKAGGCSVAEVITVGSDKELCLTRLGVSQSYSRLWDGEAGESGAEVHEANGTEDEKDR